jgi:drug/metabolite transporter (DMT)-like permease
VPGLVVAACFATAMTSFIIALNYTTIANILLMQAGVPLIAALISRIAFREAVGLPTWIAIAAVIFGVGVMVSDSLTGGVSLIGDALALLITLFFALATVVSRRYSDVRMTPAVMVATMTAFAVATMMGIGGGSDFAVSARQFLILAVFGVSLGLGLAIFTIGVRLIPSAFAALLGTGETVLGPVWAWLILSEVPKARTLLGGGIVLAALLAYLAWQLRRQRRESRIVPTMP